MVAPLEEYYAKYDEAAKDPSLLETFWSEWGDSRETACRNMRCYDQYQECGYTDKPQFDKYGWLCNDVPVADIEVVKLYGEEPLISTVECLQLPNGKWVSGSHWHLSLTGRVCGCSIWSRQHDTRINALIYEMRQLIDIIKRDKVKKDEAHIPDIVHAMDNVRQLSLF